LAKNLETNKQTNKLAKAKGLFFQIDLIWFKNTTNKQEFEE
jgi:hypothetical protein